jgi:coproporphyrinogen III oxidase
MTNRDKIVHFLRGLRSQIISEFEAFEPNHRFERTHWEHHTGGGGEISLIRGEHFEKAAVNFSAVSGPHFPMQDGSGPFFATGVSLITHMANPHAPTVHMNIRYIETANKSWVAGGYDLTPMGFFYEKDKQHFHQTAQTVLDPFGLHLYPQFSEQAKQYFYIPHWKKERGVGGIFFDHYFTEDLDVDLKLWKAVGQSLTKAILPIYEKRLSQPFTAEEKEIQLKARAHYVEFNLLYDRGTQFGFKSGGNPAAILCSMPPVAKW